MAIINSNSIESLVQTWLKAEEQGKRFPVPFDYETASYCLACINYEATKSVELTTEEKKIKYRRLKEKLTIIREARRVTPLKAEWQHDALIYLDDAVFCSLFVLIGESDDQPQEEFVYFALDKTNSLIKIGSSISPYHRIKTLETQSGRKLTHLGNIKGGKKKEFELHETFKNMRVKGEWFKAEKQLISFLKKLISKENFGQPLIGE